MFKLKAADGTNNLCGRNLKVLREKQKLSQRQLALKLQVMGYDVDHHFVRRVENGERYCIDIEVKMLCRFFGVNYEELIGPLED